MLYYLFRKELFKAIPADDVVNRQRFVLFRIFSFSASFVCVCDALKMLLTIPNPGDLPWAIIALAGVMLVNFFAVRRVNKLRTAYWILLLSSFALLHLVAYSCGGIRTGGILYYGVIILYAFMLLGRTGGQIFTYMFAANVIYFFIISTYTNLTSFDMFKNDVSLISQDFLINALFAFFLIASQGSYLQSGKNIIIQTLEKSKRDLENKNLQLEEKNYILKEYTQNLLKSNHDLDKFASIASHDLKSPLRAIGSLADFIEMDSGERMNEDSKRDLQIIKSRVKRMDLLLDALLKYSRSNRKQQQLKSVNTELLLEKIIQQSSSKRSSSFKITNTLPVIQTDEDSLKKVFEIIIENAVRFNDKAVAEITISSDENNTEWVFSIKDNGPGIDKSFHEKVFVMFQTINSRDVFESTGAGLAIAKKIIENAGGYINLVSELGKGAEFYFSIPKEANRSKRMLESTAAHL